MAIGDKRNLYISKGYTEAEYEARAMEVSFKRSCNQLLDALLMGTGFDPKDYLYSTELAALCQAPELEDQYLDWLVKDCTSPIPIIREYLKRIAMNEYLQTKDGFIAEHVRRFTLQSFERWGDPNFADATFKRCWIDRDGIEIDVQAANLTNDLGKEVTPQDLIDFAYQYPRGPRQYKAELPENRLDEAFKRMTGLTINPRYARAVLGQLSMEKAPIIEESPF